MASEHKHGGEEKLESGPSWKQIDFDRDIQLGDKIGGGGVGIIYAGRYQNQPVALKTLFDPKVGAELMQEYLDEVLVMSSLSHPNIVRFLGANMNPPNLCFVMELCDNSLFDLLHKQRAAFTTHERVQVAVDVASAMTYLHSAGESGQVKKQPLVHRDLKSHNLLIDRNGVVKLCDFGLVRTKTSMAGTPAYMAPELFEAGGGPGGGFNKSVDVYAFGVLLWEIFAQEIPFAGYDVDSIRQAVVKGERPRVPTADTPIQAREVMAACWDPSPSQRPGFPRLLADLADLLAATPQRSELEELEGSGGFGGDALDGLMSSGK